MFGELQAVSEGRLPDVHNPTWMHQHDEQERYDDIFEEERSWRDPSAHSVRASVHKWTSTDNQVNGLIKVS